MIKNLICVIYTLIKFCIMKICYRNRFKFGLIERFSPSTRVTIRKKKGYIRLGKKVRLHTQGKIVSNGGKIEIGNNVAFNSRCSVISMDNIEIGDDTMMGPNVLIYDHDHDYKAPNGIKDKKFKTGKVKIGSNVWIGANTIILRNTTIGDNCVVGAGSVIKGEYPKDSVIIQKRKTEVFNYKK